MTRKSAGRWMVLLTIAVGLRIFSLFPDAVEKYYSTGIYPFIAGLLRALLGWIPFSIGDLLYLSAGIALLVQLYRFLRTVFRKQADRALLLRVCGRVISWSLFIYIAFNLLWGLNYNRRGIADQMQMQVGPYSTQELSAVVQLIVDRLNNLDSLSRPQRLPLQQRRVLFAGAVQSYKTLSGRHPFFGYVFPSVKPSVFGWLGDYLGFTGYYNPFTGEAQVNTTVPVFVQPFTTCHEIGHQLGYAKEDEANVAGYLSASSSGNEAFRYSVYFDLYYYAAAELYVRDSNLLKPIQHQLRPGVKKDFYALQQFFRQYQNPFEPYIRKLYGKYLKANQQPQGLMSYNEVVAWVIAYYKKYGAPAV